MAWCLGGRVRFSKEDDMRRPILQFAAGAALALLVLVAVAQGKEEKVSLSKVPKAVLESVKARFSDAELTGAEKEMEDGKAVYEVAVRLKGQKLDVTLTPEGEIVLIEKEIADKDLPKPAARALEDKYPGAAHKMAEEIVKVEKKEEKLVYYEVNLAAAGKKSLEVQVTPDGKIVKEEKKGAGRDGGR